MTIWVDGDSCPAKIRSIIVRASNRTGVPAIFVANRNLPLDQGDNVSSVVVEKGDDVADRYILGHVSLEDLVITRDIPLAARLLELSVTVMNDRGTLFSSETIAERLSERDMMEKMRSWGLADSGGRTFGQKEIQAFAGLFDKVLTRKIKEHRK